MAEKEKTMTEEMNSMLLEEAGLALLPKLIPKLGFVRDKLSKFLGDNEKIILLKKQKGTDKIFLLIIETKGIESMNFDKELMNVFPVDEFMKMLQENDIGDLMKKLKAN